MRVAMQPLPLSDFDYDLPSARIAQAPMAPRDASRLMVLPAHGEVQHDVVRNLPRQLRAGDLLLVNTTKVIKARLTVFRRSGAKIECLLVRPANGDSVETACAWQAMARNAQAVKQGEVLTTVQGTALKLSRLQTKSGHGTDDPSAALYVLTSPSGPLLAVAQAEGAVPLPPYIARARPVSAADSDAYQAMFARDEGAVAAPTASLHFTPALLAAIEDSGVAVHELCLHVGAGTFLPIRPEHAADVRAHHMHAERYAIPPATAAAIERAKAEGRRVVAVGTTALRAIETYARTGQLEGDSTLYVTPGFDFAVADALLTNFHQPRSTLLLLVAAFAGRQRMLAAYQTALAMQYRFLSYGDAMFVERAPTNQK